MSGNPVTRPSTLRLGAFGARIVALAGALQLAAALALPALYQHLLGLPDAESRIVRFVLWALVPSLLVSASAAIGVGLRGVTTSSDEAVNRRRVLGIPLRVAVATLSTELVGLLGLTATLVAAHTPLPVVVGLGLCTSAVLALPAVPLFAFARVTLLPTAIALGDEKPAEGLRLSIGVQLGYSIVAVASAALVPAAVFGSAQLDVAAAADARASAQITGTRLAAAAEDLDIAGATTLVTRTPLPGGQRTILRAPSGTLLPEESAVELADQPYVEVPLTGVMRGGALRVTYAAHPIARGPLLAVTVVLFLCTLVIATSVGGAVARDLRSVTKQLERVNREEEPGVLRSVATVEVRRLLRAVNRLLERVPRFTVESFLAIERAEEAQRLKSQFLANMSHDLRSPLNSILGFSELLLRGIEGKITAQQRQQLEVVQDRGNQLLRLLTEILDTAKLESGKMELHRHNSPPVELLRAAVQEARRGRPAQVADQVTIVMQPGLSPIHVDPLRTTQAVTHLLNYAIDAAQGKKVTLRAREADVSGSARDGRLFVLELEHGGTLTPADAANLFDGFRRVTGGAGLHLALPLARRLVELHGGSLEMTGEKPPRFKVILPTGPRFGG
jgi:signal transduction histidine kinase